MRGSLKKSKVEIFEQLPHLDTFLYHFAGVGLFQKKIPCL
jgi:hypothetical protein